MPKSFAQWDLNKIPVKGLVPEVSDTAPATPSAGQLWVDSTSNTVKAYNGTAWVSLMPSASPVSTVAGRTGDVVLGAGDIASGTFGLARLPVANSGTASGTQIVRADDSRLSNSRTPTGTAGGALTGTYPSPTLGTGVVGAANINDALFPIDPAFNPTGAQPVDYALRRLGTTTHDAMPGNTRLNGITVPNGSVNLSSQRITGLAAPTATTDAVNKGYVDNLVQGLAPRESVYVATTGNITLSGSSFVIDGIEEVSVPGFRVLVKNQTNAAENGIYAVAEGAWTRAVDADSIGELVSAYVFVERGTVNGDTGWLCTVDGGTLGTTAIPWVKFTGAADLTAGNGITKTGNTLSVKPGTGVSVTSAGVGIADSGVGTTQIANAAVTGAKIAVGSVGLAGDRVFGTLPVERGGTGATDARAARMSLGALASETVPNPALTAGTWRSVTTFSAIEHVSVASLTIRDASTGEMVLMDWRYDGPSGYIQLKADVAVAAGSYNVTAVGRG